MVWEDVERLRECCLPGEVVHVTGRFGMHARYGPQLAVAKLRSAGQHEYRREALVDGPVRGPDHMEADLRWIDHTAARLDMIAKAVHG